MSEIARVIAQEAERLSRMPGYAPGSSNALGFQSKMEDAMYRILEAAKAKDQPDDCRAAFARWFHSQFAFSSPIDPNAPDATFYGAQKKHVEYIWQEGFRAGIAMKREYVGLQPIETAPRDGTEVLGYYQSDNTYIIVRFIGTHWWGCCRMQGDDQIDPPDRWTPLLKPPEQPRRG